MTMGWVRIYTPPGAKPDPKLDAFAAWTNAEADKIERRGAEELAEAELRNMEPGGWNK